MNAKLTKIRSTHSNLRTDTVVGFTTALPEVGKVFVMFAPPIDPAATFRQVTTTLVKHVEVIDNTYRFVTENSTYQLEILPD